MKLVPSWPRLPLLQLACSLALVGGGLWTGLQTNHQAPLTIGEHAHTTQPKPKPRPPFKFPGGDRTLLPNYRLVALYGTPNAPILGVLGRQDVQASIARVKKLAKAYQPYSKQPIYPTFEIITTVASGTPTANNDYSREVPIDVIHQWVIAAQKAGVYVVLDLQSGRANALSQAKLYKSVLMEPNVGLALDPEWRIHGHEQLMVDIGEMSAAEVNATADWLAQLTRQNHLPQKLFLLHQFRTDMLPDRAKIKTNHPELAYVVQMDGQGTQEQKDSTWELITKHPLPNSRYGWKNFYKMDTTLLSPAKTMAKKPKPWYVSYQ